MKRAPSTTAALTLAFPWPPAALSPNSRGRWDRIKAVTAYRHECKVLALDVRNLHRREGSVVTLVPPVRAVVTFIVPDRRKRDADNLIARFKPGFDALVDAGLLEGDDLRVFSWTWATEQGSKATAGVRVVLTEAGE